MFIPASSFTSELIVDRSRFIATISLLTNEIEVKSTLDTIKKLYPKARHYLYAYVLKNTSKSYDDGEPGKIMQGVIKQLQQANLVQALVIVVRYFGGTKLGASRLLRTYQNVVANVIKMVPKKEIKTVYYYACQLDYATFNKLKNAGYQFTNVKYFATIETEIVSFSLIDETLRSLGINNFVRKEKQEAR